MHIMGSLDVSKSAERDLRQLWRDDPDAAAAVVVVLEEIEADPQFIYKLTTYGEVEFGEDTISVKPWIKAQRTRRGLWRFRVLNTPATSYRVVYGFHYQMQQVWVLAIAHKDDLNYDELNSNLAKRVFTDWYNITGGQDT